MNKLLVTQRLLSALLVATCISGHAHFASADSGLVSSYINVSTNGDPGIWHGLAGHPSSTPRFNGTDLGTIDLGTGSLSLTGGQAVTFKNGGSDVTGADLFYSVYPDGSGPLFSDLSLSFGSNSPFTDAGGASFNSGGDQKWETLTNVDLLTTVSEPGNYVLEVFLRASSSDGDHFHSDFGNNFKATFAVTAVPEASAFLCGSLICCVVGLRRSRRPA